MKQLKLLILLLFFSPMLALAQMVTTEYGPYNVQRFSTPTTIHFNDSGLLSISIKSDNSSLRVHGAYVEYGNGQQAELPNLVGDYDRHTELHAQLPPRRRVKYITLEVGAGIRARRGQFYVKVVKYEDQEVEPNPPGPSPFPPADEADLSGHCRNRNDFELARQFAYNSDGLNMSQSEARDWARDYIHSHACNTIGEYTIRYRKLFSLYFDSDYANLPWQQAQRRALLLVETTTSNRANRMLNTYRAINSFYYDRDYLDLQFDEARHRSLEWVETQGCLGVPNINEIKSDFSRLYRLFSRRHGDRMARSMAVERLHETTHKCVHLIRY